MLYPPPGHTTTALPFFFSALGLKVSSVGLVTSTQCSAFFSSSFGCALAAVVPGTFLGQISVGTLLYCCPNIVIATSPVARVDKNRFIRCIAYGLGFALVVFASQEQRQMVSSDAAMKSFQWPVIVRLPMRWTKL